MKMNLVTCESTIQRTDYKTGEVTVCGRINCTAGSYVKVCTKNGTDDHCERCPSGTHLLDNTSSDLPTPCVTGTAIIPPPQPKSSLITTRAPTVRSTPQRTGPGRDTVTMVTLTTDSPTNTSDYQKHTSDSPTDTSDFPKHTSDSGTTTQIAIYVAIGVGVVALVVAVVVLVVICYRKRRSRPNNVPNENQMEMEPLNNTPVSTESCNRNDKTEESSAELIPNGTPQCTVGSQTTDRIMGTGERSLPDQSTQNGYINNINSPSSEEIPPQETNIKAVYTEESEKRELVSGNTHKTFGGEKRIDPSIFTGTSSEQMSNNAAAVGSTIGLLSAPDLGLDSMTKDEDYPDSIKLDAAPHLDLTASLKQLNFNDSN